jgi:hypothetical protein
MLFMSDPASEARALLPLLLKQGETVETIRSLIDVSAREEAELRQIEEKMNADRAIQHRKDIAREFERLISGYLKADGRRCP